MKYEMMFPCQVRQAIEENWPVVLPIGVLEYHSEHCCLGVDTLVVTRAMDILEKELDMIILPVFYYGAASNAVAPAAMNGSVNIDSNVLCSFGGELFKSLLEIGFRNIYVFIHHQSENFYAGMPTDLAFRLAARQTVFNFLEEKHGQGWWGDEKMSNYYTDVKTGSDPFEWISVHPFMSQALQENAPVDHAGLQETSLMISFCPEGVDMSKVAGKHWYSQTAKEATKEYGDSIKEDILDGLRKVLSKS